MDDNETAIDVWNEIVEEFKNLNATASVKGDVLTISGDGEDVEAIQLMMMQKHIPNKCKWIWTLRDFEQGTEINKYRF